MSMFKDALSFVKQNKEELLATGAGVVTLAYLGFAKNIGADDVLESAVAAGMGGVLGAIAGLTRPSHVVVKTDKDGFPTDLVLQGRASNSVCGFLKGSAVGLVGYKAAKHLPGVIASYSSDVTQIVVE